jgi:hypothetical protein
VKRLAAIAGLALIWLARAASASVTIPDPVAFLVQARCPDGQLQLTEPGCAARPQQAGDPMLVRRHDWPAPAGYMAQDALIGPDGPETLWDFAPFEAFAPSRGDGGEVYAVEGGVVRASITQDGGKPYLQGFFGAHCGGDGWVLFKTDAPSGAWASLVARLRGGDAHGPCRVGNVAFTRYRLEAVTTPWILKGRRTDLTLPTIISEHYDRGDIAASRSMERFFFARGVGRIIWEAWTRGRPASGDVAVRCPGSSWSAPPAPGWRLSDCRYATNLIAETGVMTGARFGWPPKLTSLP